MAKKMKGKPERHGEIFTPEYYAWSGMLQRCRNRNARDFKNYGARGISVCLRWQRSYLAFLEDMGRRPRRRVRSVTTGRFLTRGYSLERIDNSKSYCKSNCVWATPKTQTNNRRSSKRVLYKGRTYTVRQLASKLGLSILACHFRVSRGWSDEKLAQPMRKRGN